MAVPDSKRESLVDRYFDALDEQQYDELTEVLVEDATYEHPSTELQGSDAIREFFAGDRKTEWTDHEITAWLHGPQTSVCEGTVSGAFTDSGSFQGSFMDRFEFDEDRDRIGHVSVYTRNIY